MGGEFADVGERGAALGDAEEDDGPGGEPEGEGAVVAFKEEGEEALDGAEDGAVDEHGCSLVGCGWTVGVVMILVFIVWVGDSVRILVCATGIVVFMIIGVKVQHPVPQLRLGCRGIRQSEPTRQLEIQLDGGRLI